VRSSLRLQSEGKLELELAQKHQRSCLKPPSGQRLCVLRRLRRPSVSHDPSHRQRNWLGRESIGSCPRSRQLEGLWAEKFPEEARVNPVQSAPIVVAVSWVSKEAARCSRCPGNHLRCPDPHTGRGFSAYAASQEEWELQVNSLVFSIVVVVRQREGGMCRR
jgi:hypothetical protein